MLQKVCLSARLMTYVIQVVIDYVVTLYTVSDILNTLQNYY